ncbi:leucyl aminopeptidase family protein [Paracoccus sp. 1_MG-2023]|uniref:leucyl aminopeptidase family protein n=1 Tax=unclassified Paracoccus (in: a-proteobacteria) TaxID=2688777 RepID=UPI001C093844|nr:MULTISPECIES: leucyl aminopeptidase family protein [unclassified Paracoccus (in: a-proteobacteria)]MBU2957181.1 leucyl aminopeptidase family protein [Paracoccus sp. C2R09]MDO6669068.1 leucyl aminopeptidase family protein [Paracoccus sp. 1_MG-2023]
MTPQFAPSDATTLPLWLIWSGDDLPPEAGSWPAATGFAGQAGQICLLPDADGGLRGALMGLGDPARADRERFQIARAHALPKGDWHLANAPAGLDADALALGWLLGQYGFTRYAGTPKDGPRLRCPEGADAERAIAIASGEFLTRDLINTPACDMGPAQLEQAARDLATRIGARIEVTTGQALLDGNLPLIHAVGRAAEAEPRLIDIRIGDDGPMLTVVGKGVCFDTGGLNLKPGASMGLMKKDMGGAATALGLLSMLADTGALRGIRLRVLIPAVENNVAGNSFRPGDILTSRKGLTVEVNNTDAEGRLVLADAMALAAEENPDLMISLATLTGAARVALGPDVPPFYCDDDATAQAIQSAGMEAGDPVWRMPFWNPYESMIEPGIADLDNAPSGGMAGSITAALFLRRFAEGAARYAHFDIYGWQPSAMPGRPKGGVGQASRAILAALPRIMG